MIIRERQNIIDLIRKGVYSSCIITSYSFDFVFFEERLMPGLKSAGIKNINLFLDGNYFDEQLENTIGREFQGQRTYSINTFYNPGIFHPKILFLVGAKHGLLIIGSGNISTSGMSSNDEIWGAFHINSAESPNAPLLAQCWTYLEKFFDQTHGFNKEKIHWLYQRAPWLNELKGMNQQGFVAVNKELNISFLSNENGNSIYQKLNQIIPNDQVKSLSIVSPFFDRSGTALTNFINDFNLEHIDCLTDSESGLFPHDLDSDYHGNLKFYEWKDCVNQFDQRLNRLHAKLFNFILKDGTEFLLIGSCNATISALGSITSDALNDESAILIKRLSTNSYLEELGISVKDASPIILTKEARKSNKSDEIQSSVSHKYKILHAEKNGDKLSIILNKKVNDAIDIILRDKHLTIIERYSISGNANFSINLKESEKSVQVYLEVDENRISNIRPIQDVFMLSKTNPDPQQAEINHLIDSISQNADFSSIASIFQYLDYSRVDEDFSSLKASNRATQIRAEKQEKEYIGITEEEFNQLPAVQSYARELINHPNVQLADLIGLMGKGMIKPKEVITEDIESSLTEDNPEDQYGGDAPIGENTSYHIEGELIKKAILNHNKKVYQIHYDSISERIKKHDFSLGHVPHITLNEMSNFIILIGLLNEFYEKYYEVKVVEFAINYQNKWKGNIRRIEKKYQLLKSETVDPDDIKVAHYYVQAEWFDPLKEELKEVDSSIFIPSEEYPTEVFKHKYFTDSNFRKEHAGSIKSILIDTLGMFLLHVVNSDGFRPYDFEVLNEKMNKFRRTLFEMATSLILRVDWSENEKDYKDLLLLDLLHIIHYDPREEEGLVQNILAITKNTTRSVKKNSCLYESEIIDSYFKWKIKFEKERSSIIRDKLTLHNHSIIYKSSIGFAYAGYAKDDSIAIRKPGLWRHTDDDEYFRMVFPQSKVLIFP